MPSAARLSPPRSSASLVAIYQCLCDETRLRILHLLLHADELCVCHFQTLLEKPQVQVSKHLAYLKERGLVEATKSANWMIYRLPAQRPRELEGNLRCLQDSVQTHRIFREDLRRLKTHLRNLAAPPPAAGASPQPRAKGACR
jgi:ArsR family transcriptional regulator, arsenate/arsenite/antimonite-responsive transcriptional repressor